MQKQIIIIGGGASGLMAAIMAARSGASVTILEANDKPGRKLLASGNGKCNLTNLSQSASCYRGSDPDFIWNIINKFPAEHTIAFFTDLGLMTMQRDGWVYPQTEQAESVLQVLLMEAAALGVRIKTRETVTRVSREEGAFSVETATWSYRADAVIAACGSPASAVRGSSDTAMRLAEMIGQPAVDFMPALVPLKIKGNYSTRWAGVRVQASVTLLINGKEVIREEGNVQLAAYGISGIPVFQISRFAVRAGQEQGADVRVILDFFPMHEADHLRAILQRQSERSPQKTMKQLLTGILPEQLIPVVADGCGTIDELTDRIKAFPVEVTGSASEKHAQVSSGGILTEGLDEHLQSKIIPGLYFTGEAVDVDGTCGGYNLQWAWSSGYTAGKHAAGEHNKISPDVF